MSSFKPNYFQRRSKPRGPKANERIRALDVQVIGSDGGNLGSMPLNKAIEIAKGEGLDLIEISPNANPPVNVSSQAPGIDKSTAAIYIRIYIKDAL